MKPHAGRIAFDRYTVIGNAAAVPDDNIFTKLTEHAFKEAEIGAPDEYEVGFTTGYHLLDSAFNYEKNGFGNLLLFGVRIDTHKVPGNLREAYKKINEDAAAADNPSGFATRAQKRAAAEEAQRLLHDDLAAGKFRKSAVRLVVWDMVNHTLYMEPMGGDALERFYQLFRTAFDCDLHAVTSGTMAHRMLRDNDRDQKYEDLLPTAFTQAPQEAGDNTLPLLPWITRSVDLKDWVGNEFVLWLWWCSETREGLIPTASGDKIYLSIDKLLDTQCCWEVGGKQTLRVSGPHRLPEAIEGLAQGKWPRKVGLLLSDEVNSDAYELTLAAETLTVTGCQLPFDEDRETPREQTDGRVLKIRRLGEILDDLFEAFITLRTGKGWAKVRDAMKAWAGGAS